MANDPKRGLFFPGRPLSAAGPLRPGPAAETRATRPRPAGVPRRLVIRWAGWGALSLLVGGWANGFVRFFHPRKTAAAGRTIVAGTVAELTVGEVKAVPNGSFYLVRVPEGFLALWWKCPHLGCTVPWHEQDAVEPGDESFARQGRFYCGCHGSRYNRYGQIIQGPAPRPLDRFPLTIENGTITVEAGPSKAITRQRAGPDDAVAV